MGLTFKIENIILPTELRKRLLETIHFGDAGNNKIDGRIQNILLAERLKKLKRNQKLKNCVVCMTWG